MTIVPGCIQSINSGKKAALRTKSGLKCNPATANMQRRIPVNLHPADILFLIRDSIIVLFKYNIYTNFVKTKNIVKAEG